MVAGMREGGFELVVSQITSFQHQLREKSGQHQSLFMLERKMTQARQATCVQPQSGPFGNRLPTFHYLIADRNQVRSHLFATELADGCDGSRRTDTFGPVRTAYESRLRRLHHGLSG